MYSKKDIESMVFFDIETVHSHKHYDDLPERMKELWSKRCEYLRTRFEDNAGMTDEELYYYKGALHAEFSKIVCVSAGRAFINDESNTTALSLVTSAGDNESLILAETLKIFSKFINSGFKLVGHNITNFDIPVLLKRAVINGLDIPFNLRLHNLKPWEMPLIDTANVWSFGSWKEGLVSLDLLATVLGVDTPKDDIDGSMVSEVYYKENDIDRIAAYCDKDVIATSSVVLRMANLDIPSEIKTNVYKWN